MHAGANAAIAKPICEARFRREIVKARHHILALWILPAHEEGILHVPNLPFYLIAGCRAAQFIVTCRMA